MSSQNENTLFCPTFSSYSRDGLVEIATKVTNNIFRKEENEDESFEFALPNKESECSVMHKSCSFPVFNREIFHNLNETDKNFKNRISKSSTPSTCKKSKSTGSLLFKRFKIHDLLRRSNSDGIKSSCMFATKSNKINDGRKSPPHSFKGTTKASAHELFYRQKRSIKEGDKRKSYLPYKKDLIGIFSVLGRAF